MLEKMGGDNFPWVVLVVFSCLVSRDTESFGPSLTFHRCLYSLRALEERDCIPYWNQSQVCLLSNIII